MLSCNGGSRARNLGGLALASGGAQSPKSSRRWCPEKPVMGRLQMFGNGAGTRMVPRIRQIYGRRAQDPYGLPRAGRVQTVSMAVCNSDDRSSTRKQRTDRALFCWGGWGGGGGDVCLGWTNGCPPQVKSRRLVSAAARALSWCLWGFFGLVLLRNGFSVGVVFLVVVVFGARWCHAFVFGIGWGQWRAGATFNK